MTEVVQGVGQDQEDRENRYDKKERNSLPGEIAVAPGVMQDNEEPCHRYRYDTGIFNDGKDIIREEIGADELPDAPEGPESGSSHQAREWPGNPDIPVSPADHRQHGRYASRSSNREDEGENWRSMQHRYPFFSISIMIHFSRDFPD